MQIDHQADENARRMIINLLFDKKNDCVYINNKELYILLLKIQQHRLGPILHARMEDASAYPEIRKVCAHAYRTSIFVTLATKATLLRSVEALDAAQIAYVALKGARLAWHSYADPATRPMRDIDLLVSPKHLESAYRTLLACGFEEASGHEFSVEILGMGQKHLPALRDKITGIHVEVHSRLFEHIDHRRKSARLLQSDELISSRIWLPLDQSLIAYLPSCESLLHLLIHSAYEHRFDNGPQVLLDVASLLARETIDWRRFWDLAAEGGWAKGCLLLLQLTERHLGPQSIELVGADVEAATAEVLDAASLMLLQDTELRNDLDVQLQLNSFTGGGWADLRHLLGRFFPARRVVADFAGKSPDRRSVWLHYPAWLASRVIRTARGAVDRRQRSEIARASAVLAWLEQP